MKRIAIEPRKDWVEKVESWGLTFHTHKGRAYWNESAHYDFSASEIDALEQATLTLHGMCLEAVDFIIENNRFAQLAIPDHLKDVIIEVWEQDPPAIYGRFDLGFSGDDSPKLFEYNADTPTSLLEAAVVQWHWLQELFPDHDQFNSIWEGLCAKWSDLKDEKCIMGETIYFAHEKSYEDLMTVSVLRDTAESAGFKTQGIHMRDIGWNPGLGAFTDLDEKPIKTIFKLYPWEYLITDKFGRLATQSFKFMQWIEPIWKMLLSNKGLLAILWEMYPDHPNLLPAFFDRSQGLKSYVKKPLLSREGANIMFKSEGIYIKTGGDYGAEGYVFQQAYELPQFDGFHPVIGSWVIDGYPRGIGVRESESLITDDLASFVPHRIV